MSMQGCQGKPQITVTVKSCPQCGNEIEIFSVDTQAVCENCGFTIYNNKVTCAQWCKYAKQCVGEKMYESMMAIAKKNKEAG